MIGSSCATANVVYAMDRLSPYTNYDETKSNLTNNGPSASNSNGGSGNNAVSNNNGSGAAGGRASNLANLSIDQIFKTNHQADEINGREF
jgi:hypothetical protein